MISLSFLLQFVNYFICEVLEITFPMSNAVKKYTLKAWQEGPKSKLWLCVTKLASDVTDIDTEPITCDLALIKMTFKNTSSGLQTNMKMKRNVHENNSKLPVKIICKEIEGQFYCSDEWLEVPITKKTADSVVPCYSYHSTRGYISDNMLTYMFEINIEVQSIPTTAKTPTAPMVNNQLFEDEEFTDFELQGTDGNVPIHKAILLAHSDMVKTMLRGGKWEENKNSCMKIDGATVKSLSHLKAYMYLGILPEDGLEPLLLIASCYLMDKLRTDCIAKVASTVKPQDIESLIIFACENNMPDLMLAITSNLR